MGTQARCDAEVLSRRVFLRTLGLGAAASLPACQALQQLDTSAAGEGTGIQIVGAIMVLAKYRASPRQQNVAQSKARRAFVNRAMQPALAAEKKKVVERKSKRVAEARRQRAPEPQKTAAIQEIEKEAGSELAALDAAWKKTAANYTSGKYESSVVTTSTERAVSLTSLSESEVLSASARYVPRHIAVSVPAEKQVAGAASSVMFYDTRVHNLAKEEVYVLNKTPEPGKIAQFDDMKAQFVEQ